MTGSTIRGFTTKLQAPSKLERAAGPEPTMLILRRSRRACIPQTVTPAFENWYTLPGSNRRHSTCKEDALPTELSVCGCRSRA